MGEENPLLYSSPATKIYLTTCVLSFLAFSLFVGGVLYFKYLTISFFHPKEFSSICKHSLPKTLGIRIEWSMNIFLLPMFRWSCQPRQLVDFVIDFSGYVSHLNFLELFFEPLKCIIVLQELRILDLKHFVYVFSGDLGIDLALDYLGTDLFGKSQSF